MRVVVLIAIILEGCALRPPAYNCITDADCTDQCVARGDKECNY